MLREYKVMKMETLLQIILIIDLTWIAFLEKSENNVKHILKVVFADKTRSVNNLIYGI